MLLLWFRFEDAVVALDILLFYFSSEFLSRKMLSLQKSRKNKYCNEYLYTYHPDSAVSFRHVLLISLATHPPISLYFFAEPSDSFGITSEKVNARSLRASRVLRAVHIQILEPLDNFLYKRFRSCTVNNIRYVNSKRL